MSNLSWRSVAARLRSIAPERDASGRRADDSGPLLDEDALRRLMRLLIESGSSFTEWLTGEHEGRRKTHAVEFEDYRGYAAGDDFRLIDWNTYARLGELFVKTSLAEESMSVAVLVDCSRSMDWGAPSKLRYAKGLAAALGALALLHGDRVRAAGIGDGAAIIGAPLYGPSNLAALTDELEALPVVPTTDLVGSIASFQTPVAGYPAEQQGIVIVLSDLLAPMKEIETLDFLETQGRAVVVMHIIDPAEAAPPLSGTVELRDRETGATLIRAITPAVRRQYVKHFEDRTAALQARLAAAGIRYFAASTSVAPIDFIGSLRDGGMVAGVY